MKSKQSHVYVENKREINLQNVSIEEELKKNIKKNYKQLTVSISLPFSAGIHINKKYFVLIRHYQVANQKLFQNVVFSLGVIRGRI